MAERFYATGRRKTAVARVWVTPGGSGKITVNRKDVEEYFDKTRLQVIVEPLKQLPEHQTYDVWATVRGGGVTGPALRMRGRFSSSAATSARAMPWRRAPACPVTPPPRTVAQTS